MDGPSEEFAHSRHDGNLLRKYDIPVSHLDFQYVKTCTDGRELEKILHILQSGQEGYFPDLMRATEERLAQIKPNSKFIRKATPVLEKKLLDAQELKELSQDLSTWLEDVSKTSQELENSRRRSGSSNQPDVRKSKNNITPEAKKENDTKRIKSTDYSSWDKYDPDTEILKMDIEAERMRKDIARKENEMKKKERDVKFSQFATKAEACFEANREREKGNECFRAAEYAQAITFYTNSINYMPSANNYNNRAIARIKLKDYKQGLSDCKAALKYEPNNIKALLRLAQCHESLGELEEAVRMSERIIQIDPNNTTAQNFINKLKNQLNIKTHTKTRMKIAETGYQDEKSRINNRNNENKTITRVKIVELDDNNAKSATIKEIEDGGVKMNRNSSKISFSVVDTKGKLQSEPDLSRRPSKSILKKKHVLLPIPGPSTMPEPYYVMVENRDPEIIKRQEYILNNRPQMICLNNIDTTTDENDCLEVHIRSSHEKEAKEKKNKAKIVDLMMMSKQNGGENKENVRIGTCENGRNVSKDVKNIENLSKSKRNEYGNKLANTKLVDNNETSSLEVGNEERRHDLNEEICKSKSVEKIQDLNEEMLSKIDNNRNHTIRSQNLKEDLPENLKQTNANEKLEHLNEEALSKNDNSEIEHEVKGTTFLPLIDKNIDEENGKMVQIDLNKGNKFNEINEYIPQYNHQGLFDCDSFGKNLLEKNRLNVEENIDSLHTTEQHFPCHKEVKTNHQNSDIDNNKQYISITDDDSLQDNYFQQEPNNQSCTSASSSSANVNKSQILDGGTQREMVNDINEHLDATSQSFSRDKIIIEGKSAEEKSTNLDITSQNNNLGRTENLGLESHAEKTDYDGNNNKGDSYFISRKWNNVRGRNGRRNDDEVEGENARNDDSIIRIDGNMVVQNGRQNVQDKSEPHICRSETINVEELHMPYSFLKMWNSIGYDSTYSKHAEVLRNLDYNRLPEVIGYKLDGTMLSAIVSTLYFHFMVPHEIDRVSHLLNNLSRMQRFRIVSMFLSTTDKSRVKSLCDFLQQHGNPLPEDVMRLYF